MKGILMTFCFGLFSYVLCQEDTRNHTATSVYLSTNWHIWSKNTIQRCIDKDIYHIKKWIHVLVDRGGQFGLQNVTMYSNCEQTKQLFIDVSETPSFLSTIAKRTKCYTDNATVPSLPAYIVDILCNRSAKLPDVQKPSYDRLSPESKPVCEIYGCLTDYSLWQSCIYSENGTHSKGVEEYRTKYNTLLFGITMLLIFSFSTLSQFQREFKI